MVLADAFDIAIMLSYYWNGEMSEIIFKSKKLATAWYTASACSSLEDKERHLFLYACCICNIVCNIWER